jgi:hypothetical protein
VKWSENGRILQFFSSYASKVTIDFHELMLDKHRALEKLENILFILFPASFYEEKVQDLSVSSFSDHPCHQESIFIRADNQQLLRPLISAYSELVQRKSKKGKFAFLQSCQDFLYELVRLFYGPNGVPPRAWQTASMQFAPYQGFPRNIYIFENTVIIGNLKAKQMHKRNYPAYWALPERVGRCVLIYLGIVRDVEMEIANQVEVMERTRNPKRGNRVTRSFEEMKYYVFTRPYTRSIMKASTCWTGTLVNKALRVEARVYRHIIKAFMRKHFGPAMDWITAHVSEENDSRQQQVVLSHALHIFFGFAEATNPALVTGWPRALPDIPADHIKRAFEIARHLIVAHYGLHGGQLRIQESYSRIKRDLPFIHGGGKEWHELGDHVLVAVTSNLVYGKTQPNLLSSPPIHGYPEDVVSAAATLVRHGRF